MERRPCRRKTDPGGLEILGLPEPYADGEWERLCHSPQCVPERAGLHLSRGTTFDDLTVEHNLFVNAALFWVSRDRVGGTPPSAWRFRYNILQAIVYDDKTYPSATADCNLWIPSVGSRR